MARLRNRQAGFTLIEMMFVVAIIAVLAAITIPLFTENSRQGKAKAEISAFFGELAVREEQYKVDRGTYLAAAACPAAASSTLQSMTGCVVSGQAWGPNVSALPAGQRLNVQLPTVEGFCSYLIVSGTGTGTNNPVAGFTFTSPAGPWFYIVATCDMDGSATTNAVYFASSVDPTIQATNEGF